MSVPAGWYDDGSGRQRWWDGEQWTDHFAPLQGEAAAPAEPQPGSSAAEPEDLDATVRREDVLPAAAEAPSDAADASATSAGTPDAGDSVEAAAPEQQTTPDAAVQSSADPFAAQSGAEPAAPYSGEPAAYTPSAAPETAAFTAPGAPGYAAPADAAPGYAAPGYGAPGSGAQGSGAQPAPGYADANATAAYPPAGGYAGGGGYPGGAQPYGAPAFGAEQPASVKPPILGFVGLGLAVVGTILACIPPVLTGIGFFLLFAAFVVSLIAIFMKTKKWPAIVGLSLSVIGGIVGGAVLVFYFVSFANSMAEEFPSDFPSSLTSEEPSDEADGGTGEGRPSPDAIAAGFLEVMHSIEITDFDDPAASACIGEYFYDSDLSDDALQTIAGGEDVYGSEASAVEEVTRNAIMECATP